MPLPLLSLAPWAVKTIRYVLPVLAVVGAAAYGVHRFHGWEESLREEGRTAVRSEWEADKVRRQKQVTDLALLWDAARARADAAADQRERETYARFEAIDVPARVVSVPVLLPFDVVSVLRDSADAANGVGKSAAALRASKTPPDDVPRVPAAEYDSRTLAEWGKQAGLAYADAVGQWLRCVDEYEALTPGEAQ